MSICVKKSRRFGFKGFTLAELLVVIIMIVLLGSIGGGIYIGTYKQMKVKKAAKDLFLAAKYARLNAVGQQKEYELRFDANDNSFCIVTEILDEQTEEAAEFVVRDFYFKPAKLPDGVEFEKVLIGSTGVEQAPYEYHTSIVFRPNGTSHSAVVQVGNGDSSYTVSVCAATAKPKIYRGRANEDVIDTVDLDRR